MDTNQRLVLGIESTAMPYGVTIMEAEKIIFNTLDHEELRQIKDVPELVRKALDATGRQARDLSAIFVNQGPGGTSSVRSGISFANSLAYSLKIPVAAVNAFELMGKAAAARFNCPVLITIKSIRGTAYGGWFAEGQLQKTLYGPFQEVVEKLADTTTEFAVAGAHRAKIVALYPQRKIHDSGRKFGLVNDLVGFLPELDQRLMHFPKYALPLTEQSELFKENSL